MGEWEAAAALAAPGGRPADSEAELRGVFQGALWARGTGPLEARATLWVSCEVHPPPDQINSQCRLANNIAESLAESAAAYTKATARKCLLEKVEVITGEEAESNVLQVRRARPWGPSVRLADFSYCCVLEQNGLF